MNKGQRFLVMTVLYGLLLPLIGCQDLPHRGEPMEELSAKILTESKSVRTRLGEYLAGYLAEYESNFEMHRVFLALEIQKYERGEKLAVKGRFTQDSVRMSYANRVDVDFPVFEIEKAEPARPKEIPIK
jgi:hypothetical protein